MSQRDLIQIALFVGTVFVVTPLMGRYMAAVFAGERISARTLLGGVEKVIYLLAGVDPRREMGWGRYFGAVLAFSLFGVLAVVGIQMTQQFLPLNPQKLPNVPFPLAFNMAVSFVTNANSSAYAGEPAMSYGTQILAICVQRFVSAATGMAVAMAFIRGLVRRSSGTVGNFWADLTRAILYILLPLSLVFAVVLVGQGVVQSFAPYREATTLEGARQVIPLGPAASQVAIEVLGTSGGGPFGQNSAHPSENPTPFSNFLQMVAILSIPAGLTYTFGCMAGNRRQGWVLFGAMLFLFLAGLAVAGLAETATNAATGLTASMEGKETRFGVMNSVLFANVATGASCGAANAVHDSFSPLAGMVAMINMMLGGVMFGGVGAGLYGILVFAILAVFIAGLLVGRTPEYLGKKIEARDIACAVAAVIAPTAAILAGTALACVAGASNSIHPGPHGFSEILYSWTAAVANNGSESAGGNPNANLHHFLAASAMGVGRFAVIAAVLALGGNLGGKRAAQPSAATFPTDRFTFAALLVGVVLIVGALACFPALSLGPLAEHLLARAGRIF